MANASNIKELEALINKKLMNALKTDVAKVVKNTQQEKVKTSVYDRYSPGTSDGEPWVYKRRKENGGLADQKNMIDVVSVSSTGVELSVQNIAKGSKDKSMEIAGLVEYGDDAGYGEYDYKLNRDGTSEQYLQPRPFIEETRKELASGKAKEALIKGLKNQGIIVN